MQAAKDAREARRRRILDRGADRLAYITGELKNSPLPVKHTELASHKESSSIAPDQDFQEGVTAESFVKGALDLSPPLKENGADDIQPTEGFEKAALELGFRLGENGADGIPPTDSTAIPFDMSHPRSSSRSSVPSGKADSISRGEYQWSPVREIIQVIDASEGLRALVAFSLAVVIVFQILLSSCGHPWGVLMYTWLPRWPLSLIFLTDFTIVLGAFLFCSSRKLVDNKLLDVDSDLGSFTKALDVVQKFEHFLGIGILCKKAASALTLDCSIYAVVLVCGLSLGKYVFSCSQLPGP